MTAADQRSLKRLRILGDLGIDVYAARRPLAGAAPSRLYAAPGPVTEVQVPLQEQLSRRRPAPQPIHEVALPDVGESPLPTPAAPVLAPASSGVRFRCRAATWAWPQEVLIIADVEGFADKRARMQALARLIADVRRSINARGEDTSVQFSRFDWPVADASLADSSLRRAAEVFGGFLHQRLADNAITAVIVLGEIPASLLAAVLERGKLPVPFVVGPPPAELFADAAGKVELWRALQTLRHSERA